MKVQLYCVYSVSNISFYSTIAVIEKLTRAFYFQIALETMLLPILVVGNFFTNRSLIRTSDIVLTDLVLI